MAAGFENRTWSLPLGREKGYRSLDCSGGFHSKHTVDKKFERGEVMTLMTAGNGIGSLLLPLVLFQDLVRVHTKVRFGVRISDPDVKDRRVLTFPKAADSDVPFKVQPDQFLHQCSQ